MKNVVLASLFMLTTTMTFAQTSNVMDVVMSSKDHSTLVSALKAADLVTTLKGTGPFTIFAPTNAAFDKMTPLSLEALLKPEKKPSLSAILTSHVVPGNLDVAALKEAITAGNGRAILTTLNGTKISVAMYGDKMIVIDPREGRALMTLSDQKASNGVIHVIDLVLMQ